MADPVKGQPLPADHHVLRYIGRRHVDGGTKQINGSGFLPRPGEDDGASCNWMECFAEPTGHQYERIIALRRIKYEKRSKLVRLNVGQTTDFINTEAAKHNPINFAIVHDPLDPEDPFAEGIRQ